MTRRHSPRRFALALAALLVPAMAAAAPANPPAQGGGGPAMGAGGTQTPAPGPAARAQAIQQQLMQIRAETLEANPDLAERQEALGDLVRETMREAGHTPEADLAKMGEIRETLQDGDVAGEERETLIQEFNDLRAGFMGARQQAMASDEVQAQGQAFQESLMAAMVEQDPRTEQLMQRMSQLQQQFGGGR
jgi:hypothetical protein